MAFEWIFQVDAPKLVRELHRYAALNATVPFYLLVVEFPVLRSATLDNTFSSSSMNHAGVL